MDTSTQRTFRDMLSDSPRTLKNVLRAQDFRDRGFLAELFAIAGWLEKNQTNCMQGKKLVLLFNEPSTRTRLSFAFAGERLGANIHAVVRSDSSQEKGESIEDTVRTIVAIGADGIVLRHPNEDAVWRAALVCPVPIINGGSGKEHHPTQALLDVYTIFREVGTLDNLNIALVGDLAFGRTTNSLAYLLSKFSGVTIYLVSPEHLRMKGELVYYLSTAQGVTVKETSDLESVIHKVHVVYQTRAQKERAPDPTMHAQLSQYMIDRRMVERMKPGAIVLHPLPRNEELSREVDDMPQAKYIDQMRYGELIRRALLAKIFG